MKRILFPLAALCCLGAAAQTHPVKANESHSVQVVAGDTVGSADIYEHFAEVSPAAFNVPSAPRFAFVGKDRKFYLGIGGTLKATVSYDMGDVIQNPNEFTTSAIDMTPQAGNRRLVQFSGQQSSLFLNFVALPGTRDQVGVYIQGNFLGNGYGLQLQYAYARYRGFTAGYDYSLFTDVAAAPPTIDYEGPNAFTAIPNAVLDYRHSFGKWGIGVGAELPQASFTTSATTRKVTQGVPDIPAYVQYNFGDNSWVRASVIMRDLAYRDLSTTKNRHATGWGVKVSGSATAGPLTAYYQALYGRGVASYIQDLNGLGMDLMPSDEAGHLDAVKVWGAYGGLQYNFSPKFYVSATYSHVRAYADTYAHGETPWSGQYKYAQYAVANAFYNINSVVSVGAEYIWGRRVDNSGTGHHDSRLQAALMVNF